MPPRSASSSVSPATLKQRMLRQLVCGDRYERQARRQGATAIAGVDEVGRGALFGPVVAAAVILPPRIDLKGLRDSKQLRASDRERLADEVRACAIALAIAEVDAETIDRINIYQATRLAMLRAVEQLCPKPDHLLIDAMRIDHPCAQTSIVYGDSLSRSIAAASVIAKVYRDRLVCELHALYPEYGLDAHKGYGTPRHKAALLQYGPTPLHRKSFAPVTQSRLFLNEESSAQESVI
uniref:Ribonuclease HII n=1 Tax=Acidobacterium capsulatum TaxID=33075 RepID=A0A7V4XSM2_9BACT